MNSVEITISVSYSVDLDEYGHFFVEIFDCKFIRRSCGIVAIKNNLYKLQFQDQDYLKDEVDFHLEDFLQSNVIETEMPEGLYHMVLDATIQWVPNGYEYIKEVESDFIIDSLENELITNNKDAIDSLFFEGLNEKLKPGVESEITNII